MNMEEFLIERGVMKEPRGIDDYGFLRDAYTKYIEDGMKSPRFLKIKKKADAGRYDSIETSRSICWQDALILWQLTKYFKPQIILEIGTWLGTSAMVMRAAQEAVDNYDGRIYTCDKHNLYYGKDKAILYHHGTSNELIKILKAYRVPLDFVFADGGLMTGDAKRINRLSRCKIFVTHDYRIRTRPEKGILNIEKMRKVWPKAKFIKPMKGSSLAMLLEGE